jgi:hypothetical protein
MREVPFHVLIEGVIFLAMLLIALGSFGYAAWKWWKGAETRKLPVWRRVATMIAFLAVGTQIIVFAASWFPQIGRDYVMFGRWARWVLPPFLVAVPSSIAGKRGLRWLLLTASILLFVICFLITLSA